MLTPTPTDQTPGPTPTPDLSTEPPTTEPPDTPTATPTPTGPPNSLTPAPDQDSDGTPDGRDCAPEDAAIHPGATELCDGIDNDCDGQRDEGFPDSDQDHQADCVDDCPLDPLDDVDLDGICGDEDVCPEVADGQRDSDGDGQGDACDACPMDGEDDRDSDGICGNVDNCSSSANPDQADADRDGRGDVCDACPADPDNDHDSDGVCGDVDVCPEVSDGQRDSDGDGQGDACDPCPTEPLNDPDGDGLCGTAENPYGAPYLDQTSVSAFSDSVEFLLEGDSASQQGMSGDPIDDTRVAVIRGQVADRDGAGLAGVRVEVLHQPELGYTLSREDGTWDLVVNGGGPLVVALSLDGYLPAQRQLEVPWQDYIWCPDVVLIPYDSAVTTVSFAGNSSLQVARGSVSADADGTREATLLIPEGVTATLVKPDNSTQAASMLHLRATEYTVGGDGPMAMPAPLPPSSGYTYAVELSADEAVSADARVMFSKPLYFYLENFLGFPVGARVPAGYYDRDAGVWMASENGVILQIIALSQGKAQIDVNGDGAVDSGSALTSLGITASELTALAQLYTAGTSLWRVPVPHMTPWDYNFPFGPPLGARAPKLPPPKNTAEQPEKKPCEQAGSIINCRERTLGEAIPVPGTGLELHYQSNLAAGVQPALEIPLIVGEPPEPLTMVGLEIQVAGQRIQQEFTPAPDRSTTFTWNGLDGYGRQVSGAAQARVRIDYRYPLEYHEPAELAESFGQLGGDTFEINRQTNEISLSQAWEGSIGGFHPPLKLMGGWMLSTHHFYDPHGQVLYLGNGERRSASLVGGEVVTVAGDGYYGDSGDDGPASEAELSAPYGMTIGPDGTIYVADTLNQVIRKIARSGTISRLAGTGLEGYNGDNIPATSAMLNYPWAIHMDRDGNLLIADDLNQRIRKIDLSTGLIHTIAGTGTVGSTGDGGPATLATLTYPVDCAPGPDGSIYIAEGNTYRVRRIAPDGNIFAFAGNGIRGDTGDGGPALEASFRYPYRTFAASSGDVYIADSGSDNVRRVRTDGIIELVAGSGSGFGGDGGPATLAMLNDPAGITMAPDGSLLIGDEGNERVRQVLTDGTIRTVMGSDYIRYEAESAPPLAIDISEVDALQFGPDGNLYVADNRRSRIRKVTSSLPGLGHNGEVFIPSATGEELYRFDATGRHLETRSPLTGATLRSFKYNGQGLLTSITEGNGLVTTIERAQDGTPSAIVGPYGHRTALLIDANGNLSRVTDPSGAATTMGYASGGLLTSLKRPTGGEHTFAYDTAGRLETDVGPEGRTLTVSHTQSTSARETRYTTGEGRVTVYHKEELATGEELRRTTIASGLITTTELASDGSVDASLPGVLGLYRLETPHPRFGMLSPVATAEERYTGSLDAYVEREQTFDPIDPADPTSPALSATWSTTVNRRTYTRTWDGSTRTFTDSSPEGRDIKRIVDTQGRVLSLQVGSFAPLVLGRDTLGRLISASNSANSVTRSVGLQYDAGGRPTKITDASGAAIDITYDAVDRPLSRTLPDGSVIGYTWDAVGRLTGLTPPGRSRHLLSYDRAGRSTGYAPPAVAQTNGSITATYTSDGELYQVTRADGRKVTFTHDKGGRLASTEFDQGTLAYGYEAATGLLSAATAPGTSFVLDYDGLLPVGLTVSGAFKASADFAFDDDLRLVQETVDGGSAVGFGYDDDDLLTQAGSEEILRSYDHNLVMGTVVGVLEEARDYSAFADLEQISLMAGQTGLMDLQYTYDNAGRIIEALETVGSSTQRLLYQFDKVGRLTAVTVDGATVYAYGWDANGNLVSRTAPDGTVSGTVDGQDRLVSLGATQLTWTDSGELQTRKTSTGTTRYEYDILGCLRKVVLENGTELTYLCDAEQRRVARYVNGSLQRGYLYARDGRLIAEYDGSGVLRSQYVYGTHPTAPDLILRGGHTYKIQKDPRGSPRLVIDVDSGAVVQRMVFDPMGRITEDTSPGFQPFGFAGGLYDIDTGLIRFGARDYMPELGRWTARDPILFDGGNPNLYAYIDGDPLTRTDPDGTVPIPLITGAIGALANGGANLAWQIWCKGLDCTDWGDVGIATGVGFVSGAAAPLVATSLVSAAVLGAAANVEQYGLTNRYHGQEDTAQGFITNAATGAAGGLIGGTGAQSAAQAIERQALAKGVAGSAVSNECLF